MSDTEDAVSTTLDATQQVDTNDPFPIIQAGPTYRCYLITAKRVNAGTTETVASEVARALVAVLTRWHIVYGSRTGQKEPVGVYVHPEVARRLSPKIHYEIDWEEEGPTPYVAVVGVHQWEKQVDTVAIG